MTQQAKINTKYTFQGEKTAGNEVREPRLMLEKMRKGCHVRWTPANLHPETRRGTKEVPVPKSNNRKNCKRQLGSIPGGQTNLGVLAMWS